MINQLYQQATKLIEQKAYQQAHQCLLKILSQDREFADAYYLMAVIASDHGNFTKAVSIAEKACELAFKPQYAVFVAKLFVQLHDHVKAKHWADKAIEASEQNTSPNANLTGPMLDNLGVVYSQVGQHAIATQMFKKAINSSQVNNVPAQLHTNLASSYKFCGDFSAAKRHYKLALKQDRHCYTALWSLASLGELPSEQEAGQLTTMLDANPECALPINDKLHIAHTLARYHEKQGNYAQAYELLAKVKAEKKQQLGYDFEQDLALFEALTDKFSLETKQQNLLKAPQQTHALTSKEALTDKSNEAIFIVGMPRTGTTVVERLLSQSDNITSAGEMQHFAIALKKMSKTVSPSLLDLEVISASDSIDWQIGRAHV